MKKCKYHCDYGDGKNCHYKEKDGCVFTKRRRLTDTESMGMPFDDLPDVPDNVILSVNKTEYKKNTKSKMHSKAIGFLSETILVFHHLMDQVNIF